MTQPLADSASLSIALRAILRVVDDTMPIQAVTGGSSIGERLGDRVETDAGIWIYLVPAPGCRALLFVGAIAAMARLLPQRTPVFRKGPWCRRKVAIYRMKATPSTLKRGPHYSDHSGKRGRGECPYCDSSFPET